VNAAKVGKAAPFSRPISRLAANRGAIRSDPATRFPRCRRRRAQRAALPPEPGAGRAADGSANNDAASLRMWLSAIFASASALGALIASAWERIATDPAVVDGLGVLCAAREPLTVVSVRSA